MEISAPTSHGRQIKIISSGGGEDDGQRGSGADSILRLTDAY